MNQHTLSFRLKLFNTRQFFRSENKKVLYKRKLKDAPKCATKMQYSHSLFINCAVSKNLLF